MKYSATLKLITVLIVLGAIAFLYRDVRNWLAPDVEITYPAVPVADVNITVLSHSEDLILNTSVKVGRDKIIQQTKEDTTKITYLRRRIARLADSLEQALYGRDSIAVLYKAIKRFVTPDSAFGGVVEVSQTTLPFASDLGVRITDAWVKEKHYTPRLTYGFVLGAGYAFNSQAFDGFAGFGIMYNLGGLFYGDRRHTFSQ